MGMCVVRGERRIGMSEKNRLESPLHKIQLWSSLELCSEDTYPVCTGLVTSKRISIGIVARNKCEAKENA